MSRKTQIYFLSDQIKSLKEAKNTILSSYDILISQEEETTYKTILSELNKLINSKINELTYLEERKEYEFYFRYQPEGEKHIVTQRTCKRPELTKQYKELKKNFNCGFIAAYGYDLTD